MIKYTDKTIAEWFQYMFENKLNEDTCRAVTRRFESYIIPLDRHYSDKQLNIAVSTDYIRNYKTLNVWLTI